MRFKLPARAGRSRLRRGIAAAAAAALGCAGLAAVAATQASAAVVCQVGYTVNQWSTGFTAAVTITNTGTPVTSWTLAYSYTGNQALTQGWSGNWTQSGENVTVTNASWNGSLATGGSTSLGANFSYSGTNTAPTDPPLDRGRRHGRRLAAGEPADVHRGAGHERSDRREPVRGAHREHHRG